MIAIIIALVVVGLALYFTNVICSWGIGNKCPSPVINSQSVQTPIPTQTTESAECTGRFYKECITDNECQTGQKCQPISINFSQVMMCS